MMERKTPAAVVLFFCLLGLTAAEICFEPYPDNPIRVTEMQRSVCVSVVRDASDPDVFQYRAVSIANLDADRAALEGDDFTAVPSGAVLGDNPPRYQTVTFAPNSTTLEICVNIEPDRLACEEEEMFQIELSSPDACGGMNFTYLLVSIEDSTHIPVRFENTKITIKENDNFLRLDVIRDDIGARNIKQVKLRIREDPQNGGCLKSDGFVTYGCQDFKCRTLGLQFDAFLRKTVELPLLPDDTTVDGHRVCTLVMEGASQCKFSFTNGNRMKLVVEDDEYIRVYFNASTIEVQEDAGVVELTLMSSVAVHQPFTVTLQTSPSEGGATADVDFQSGDYNATFQAGDRTATAAIVLIDDDLVEFIEGFIVSIVEVPGMFHVNPGPSLFVDIIDDESRNGRVRLVDGVDGSEGHVELQYSQIWGRVCDDWWDVMEGDVVCRQLGFKRAENVYLESHFGTGNSSVLWLDNLRCTGSEKTLLECSGNPVGLHNCNPFFESAGVRCTNKEAGAPPLKNLRLAAGAGPSEGRVEVFVNGHWGTVCDDNWNLNNSNVVCRQLGYHSAITSYSGGVSLRGQGSIWLDEVSCTGQEESLLLCSHANIGESDCNHMEDIVVWCNRTDCLLSCENGGTLDTELCLCDCPPHFTGQLCDTCILMCQNGGTLDPDSCTCDCLPEFSGDVCETCAKTCDNGGSLDREACKCVCTDGFSGGSCEVCVQKNCMNGGTQDPNTCDCACTPEYSGELCETCATKTCMNEGRQDPNTCDCVCPADYTGEFCENCVTKNCMNHGTQDPNTCDCVCPADYTGDFCETCLTKTCMNGGTQDPNTCGCVCPLEYTGSLCENCVAKVCMNGGAQDSTTCDCLCLPNYTGYMCETCVLKNCTNGGTQDPNTCDCVCPLQYTGEFCETCVERNCTNGGTLDPVSCQCVCPPEYSGELCENIRVYFNASTIEVQEDAGAVELTLLSSVAVHQPFTVTLRASPSEGGATADVDFQSGDYNATFQAGDRTATAAIVLIDDDLVEFIEGFIVSIVEVPGMFHVNPGPSLFVDIIDDESRDGRVRLVDGADDSEGHVELLILQTWGRVCDDWWDVMEGDVVCRQLGFKRAENVYLESHFGTGNSSVLWLDNLQCTGSEETLLECSGNPVGLHNCNPFFESAGVRCTNKEAGAPPLKNLRLAAGADPSEGRVEVFVNGHWGTVCDDNWNLNNSNVVCRQLGYHSAITSYSGGVSLRGQGSIWLDEVSCTGQEKSLLLCSHANIGESDCNHVEDIVVRCHRTDCLLSCENGGTLDTELCLCDCPPRFTGQLCDTCLTKTCMNGGTQDPNTCGCVCPPEYTGSLCENCVAKVCMNGGAQDSTTCDCLCLPNYTGYMCETCVLKNCTNGGTQDPNTCDCVCPLQYTGEFCETCVERNCTNGGTLDPVSCQCVCPPEYSGELCENAQPMCPPTCSHALCKGKKHKSLLCVAHGAASCGNPCGAVTSCTACYYSKLKRPLPDGCAAQLSNCEGSSAEGLKDCLLNWGQCLQTRYSELYGETKRSLKRARNFKCFSSPC